MVSKKVSDSVLKIFGIGKVSDSVSAEFGIGKKFRIRFHSDFGYRHTLGEILVRAATAIPQVDGRHVLDEREFLKFFHNLLTREDLVQIFDQVLISFAPAQVPGTDL